MTNYYSYQPEQLVEEFRTFKASLEKEISKSLNTVDTNEEPSQERAIQRRKSSGSVPFVVAAIQFTAGGISSSSNISGFWDIIEESIRVAAKEKDAQLILVPELFLGPYFCQSQEACLMEIAWENVLDSSSCPIIHKMQIIAKEYGIVLPVSLYEREKNMLYNTIVMIDGNGTILGKYRKSHIPDADGYEEKFYFSSGDTGFKVWDTILGKVGVGICWDQWFPEAARAMALMGADILLYPTAIGTEPNDPTIDSSDHWQRVMQGHAAANMIPVVASNRQGTEILLDQNGKEKQRMTFYGRSFITDITGKLVAHAEDNNNNNDLSSSTGVDVSSSPPPFTILTSTIDPLANRTARLPWGLFRDRRPELYHTLLTLDGKTS